MALSRRDVARLVQEIGPALAGGVVLHAWRESDEVVRLDVRTSERRALEIALDADAARVVALPPEDVPDFFDKKKRKAAAIDGHPFAVKLKRFVVGRRVDKVEQVAGDRVVVVELGVAPPTASRVEESDDDVSSPEGGERVKLAIELIGRAGNIAIVDSESTIVATFRPGRPSRPLEVGTKWEPPASRPAPEHETETAPGVAPDPATLALSRAVARSQRTVAAEGAAAHRKDALARAIEQGLKKNRGLIEKLEREREEAAKADELQKRGELLKANASSIPRGATSAKLIDYSSGEAREVEVELDPSEPVLDQARELFKRAKKLERGLVSVETRLGEADGRIDALAKLEARVASADASDTATLDAIERELGKLGVSLPQDARPAPPPAEKKKVEPSGPRRFVSKDRLQILVGRSNQENDRLTLTIAHGNDMFLHVRGYPGSHVIVRAQPGKSIPLDTLLDAAALAVHFSKVRGNLRAEVTYTPRKFVRKPRGAKPGLVEVANEKTIRPDGDPARLARILATSGQGAGANEPKANSPHAQRKPDDLGSSAASAQPADDDEEWSEDA